MEINMNNFGVSREMMATGFDEVKHETNNASNASRVKPDFTVSTPVDGLATAEPIAEVPDEALVRDDTLGCLVNSAFNMPPPPMPSFGEP